MEVLLFCEFFFNLLSTFCSEPSKVFVPESGSVTLTITRDDPIDRVVKVKYRTVDGSATVEDSDYVPIVSTTVLFESGVRYYSFTVETIQDSRPETDEVFYVEVYDAEPEGQMVQTIVFFGRNEQKSLMIFCGEGL